MPLDRLTVEDVSGERGHSETTPPPKYKIGNMKRKREEEEEKEEEEDEKEGKTEAVKRVRRGDEGRERGRRARWRITGRHTVQLESFAG